MAGLIRRAVLGGALVAGAGALVAWRWRGEGSSAVEVAYGSGPRQIMDITLPPGQGPFPALVMIHGGAFLMGDKSDLTIPPEVLAAGIAVVRLNYRLSGTDLWPAQGQDCLAAIVKLQRDGLALGLEPSRLVLMGQSAGAFLAVTTALSLVEVGLPPRGVISFFGPMDFSLMDADMAALGRTARMGPTDAAYSPESQLLGFAVADNRAAARAIGPIARLERLHEPLPPILIRHGDADPMIADLQAQRLQRAWAAADPEAAIDFALVPGAGHGGTAFESGPVLDDTLAFVRRQLLDAA